MSKVNCFTNKCTFLKNQTANKESYSVYYFDDGREFSAKFIQFDSPKFQKINDFVLSLIETYFLNISQNLCTGIDFKSVFLNDKFVSVLLVLNYVDCLRYKSLNFDLTTLSPVPHALLLKKIKLKKSHLNKTAAKVDKKLKVDFDTVHLYRETLKFFCKNNKNGDFVSFRLEIP